MIVLIIVRVPIVQIIVIEVIESITFRGITFITKFVSMKL